PGDEVARRPGLDAGIEEGGWPRDAGKRCVKALAHRDDVEPTAGFVPALEILPRGPAADDFGTRSGDAELVVAKSREERRLCADLLRWAVERLQHTVADPPRTPRSTRQRP